MLGNLAGFRTFALSVATLATVATFAFLGAGCPVSVSQDKSTGPDGKPKGAKKVPLENNEGKARGIVTYPGGDRVDWRLIELPEGKTGTLGLRLKWQPPRPGLDLSFDVYDEWGTRVAGAKPKKGGHKTSKKASIEGAKGKYYIQIYASGRGDAGKYTLTASFEEGSGGIDPGSIEIPDPPKLPAIPAAAIPCDENAFDKKNPACKAVCPNPPDMTWPACSGKCPNPPDPSLPQCQQTMACPNPPDRRIRACTADKFPKCNFQQRDPGNPNCDVIPPVRGRINSAQAVSDGVRITIGRGSKEGIERGWKGTLLKRGQPLPGGEFVVLSVSEKEAVGKVKLPLDMVLANKEVELHAP